MKKQKDSDFDTVRKYRKLVENKNLRLREWDRILLKFVVPPYLK